jgi:hypothetical protein
MAYNTRFKASFKDLFGIDYLVEIKEDNFAGQPIEIDCGPNGFRMSYSGSNKTIQNYILGSKVEIDLFISTDTEKEFIKDLALNDDQHFLMSITRDKGSGFEAFWVGYVLADLVSFNDEVYPFVFKVVATDCFSALRNIDYTNSVWDAAGEPSDVELSINSLIHETIELSGLTDHFDGGRWLAYTNDLPFLPTGYNSSLANKLRAIGFNTNVFAQYDTSVDGVGFKYTNCYDVLEQVCKIFNARMFQWEGYIWFVPYYIYETNQLSCDFKVSDSSGTGDLDYGTIDLYADESDFNRFIGGIFDFTPAVKEVCVEHKYYYDPLTADTSELGPCGSSPTLKSYDLESGIDLTSFDGYKGSADVNIDLGFDYHLIWAGSTLPNPPNNYRLVMRFRIRSGNYSLKNDTATSYTPTTDLTFTTPTWHQDGEMTYTGFTAGQTVLDISSMDCLDLPNSNIYIKVFKNGEILPGVNWIYSKANLNITFTSGLAIDDVVTILIDYSSVVTFSVDVTDNFILTTAGTIIYNSNDTFQTTIPVTLPITDVPAAGLLIQHSRYQPYDDSDPASLDFYNSDFYLRPRSDEIGTYLSAHLLYQHPYLGVEFPGGDISTMNFRMNEIVPTGIYTAQPSNSTETTKTCVVNATNSSEKVKIQTLIGGNTAQPSDGHILFQKLGVAGWSKADEWSFNTTTNVTFTGELNECIAEMNARLMSTPSLRYQGDIQRATSETFHPVKGLKVKGFNATAEGMFMSTATLSAYNAEWSVQLVQL